MSIFKSCTRWCLDMARVFRNELRLIVSDMGVLLFFVGLPLLYPVVYTLIYNPEVVRQIPVAVVDDSRTAASRDLVRRASASPAIQIYDYCTDLPEARQLMAEGKVFGILSIPSDYDRAIGTGSTAHVSFFSDMSLLLRYRSFVSAMTDLQIEVIGDITSQKVDALGAESYMEGHSPMVQSSSNFLGDTEQGFASFVIPGIVILILQQSMLLGICLIGGTARERRRRNGGIDPQSINGISAWATVWGKALACTFFYIPLTLYVTRIIPEMFNLPHYGDPADYLLFMLPLLLATAFLGQTLVLFMKERESAFIIIVFTSAVFLFLSGLTWPRYAMSPLWRAVGDCIPAIWGVEGFIRINSNAATLGEVSTPFIAMWILAAVYMITAVWVTKYINVSASIKAAAKVKQ